MRPPVIKIAYKYCVNLAKTEFPYQLTLSLRCKYCKIHSCSIFPDAINSIRCSAAERLQANDVSLLWRHSSRVRSGTLDSAYWRPFWRFLGNLNPKMLSAIVWTTRRHFLTLRHNACYETFRVKFHARVASVGESGEQKINQNKKR